MDKGIPTLVIAAASVDDVLAISGFTILLGITFKPDADLVSIIFQGPLEAFVGLLFGTAFGALVAFLPARDPNSTRSSLTCPETTHDLDSVFCYCLSGS